MTDLQAKAMMLADMPTEEMDKWMKKYRHCLNQLRMDEQNTQDKGATIEISDLTSAQWQRLAELVGKFEKADEKDEEIDWDEEDEKLSSEPTNVFIEHDEQDAV